MISSLYEQPPFRSAAGDELRPGGLALTEQLAECCDLRPGSRVLDLGCGVGSTASFLRQRWGARCFGLDSSAHLLEEAAARDRAVTWLLGRAEEIPCPDGSFDAVFCECFLSTLTDPALVLGEIGRVLRPSGRLAVTDLYLRRPEARESTDAAGAEEAAGVASAPGAGETALPPGPAPGGSCVLGALGQGATLELFEDAGFAVRVWRDCSDALKVLSASLIFAYGSVAALWEALLGEDAGLRISVKHTRPGYYLLVAEPRPGRGGALD